MRQPTIKVTVGFRSTSVNDTTTPKGTQLLRLVINGTPNSSYYVYADSDDPSAPHVVARTRIRQLNSPQTRTLALECIENCTRNHQHCTSLQIAILPTRVIDCSDPFKPKLHLGNNQQAPYIALSYVWGESQPHSTTTSNLDTYLAGIDLCLLPQTIKDAIISTHEFGFCYLWADSLCILQDSAKDKEREIAQMRTIFRNAYVTIIAASADKVSEGFLQNRPHTSSSDVSLPFYCPDGQIGTISLSPVWRQYDGSSEPVNQRAWCLEERLLSPRSLVYASHTLQYHCQTCIVNVGGAVCGPMIGQRLPNLLLLPDSDIPSSLSKSDERMLRWSWMEVLGDYTQRAVTKPGDKLVAFAAMAEQFYRVWKSEYIAGLWRSTLVRDLLWYKDYETRYLRPEKYRAPSWSWAGVDGRILAYTMDDRLSVDDADVEACEILSCQITLATAFLPFGKVKSGTLVLRSVLQRATWNPDAMMPDLYVPEEHPQTLIDDEAQPSKGQAHIGCAYPDSLEDARIDVWAIPVRWNRKSQYVAGLIVTSAAEGQYRRIGYFHSPENALGGLSWMDQELHDVVIV